MGTSRRMALVVLSLVLVGLVSQLGLGELLKVTPLLPAGSSKLGPGVFIRSLHGFLFEFSSVFLIDFKLKKVIFSNIFVE